LTNETTTAWRLRRASLWPRAKRM